MCKVGKKVLIAGLIVLGVGLLLRKTELGSLASVWWKDACVAADKNLPPELRLKQLEQAIDSIDARIKGEISRLADLQATFEEQDLKQADSLRAALAKRKEAIASLTRQLEGSTQAVSTGAADRLDDLVKDYDRKQQELQALEEVLTSKREMLAVRKDRIAQMRQQHLDLKKTAAQLATRLEKARLQQSEDRNSDEAAQVDRCQELITKVERDLKRMEKEGELLTEFGYRTAKPVAKPTRPTEEVLKAARRILDNDK